MFCQFASKIISGALLKFWCWNEFWFRSSESPQSTSLDTVPGAHSHGHHGHHHTHSTASSASAQAAAAAAWDSDMDIDPDTPDWQSSVSEEILARLHPEEKKRQEIINGKILNPQLSSNLSLFTPPSTPLLAQSTFF